MITTIVYVRVKPEHIEEFITATVKNHEQSVKEPGNLRFDVLQQQDDASAFAIYEAYESEEMALSHKKTPHYLEWREKVAGWMAEPRKGVKYNIVRP